MDGARVAQWMERADKLSQEAAAASSNSERMRIYCDAELLLLDIEEGMGCEAGNAEVSGLTSTLRATASSMKLQTERRPFLSVLARFICVLMYLSLVGLPFLAIMLPFRWFGVVLRKLGWSTNNLPSDTSQSLVTRGLLASFGVAVSAEGHENVDPSKPAVLMFSHSSNIDALALTAHSPLVPKWIGKRALFLIPFLGWLLRAYGHFPIDRTNLEVAKKQLAAAAQYCRDWGRSVGVAPEGTRSTTGLLLPFKKGPFHTARALGIAVQPVVFFNSFELWPPSQLAPTPGVVCMRFLTPLAHDPDASIEETMIRVRRVMLQGMRDVPASYSDHRTARLRCRGTRLLGDILTALILAAPVLYWFGFTSGVILWGVPSSLLFGEVPEWLKAVIAVVLLAFLKASIEARTPIGPPASPRRVHPHPPSM